MAFPLQNRSNERISIARENLVASVFSARKFNEAPKNTAKVR